MNAEIPRATSLDSVGPLQQPRLAVAYQCHHGYLVYLVSSAGSLLSTPGGSPNLPPVAQQQIVELYRMLAVAVEAGSHITGALSTLARYHFNRACASVCCMLAMKIDKARMSAGPCPIAFDKCWRGRRAVQGPPNNRVAAWTLRELAQKKFVVASRRTATWPLWSSHAHLVVRRIWCMGLYRFLPIPRRLHCQYLRFLQPIDYPNPKLCAQCQEREKHNEIRMVCRRSRRGGFTMLELLVSPSC